MSNKYGLPESEVDRVRARDKRCVYCGKEMVKPIRGKSSRDWATIEHLNHIPPWNNPETIAISCGSCNSSRGQKPILEWFETAYCREKGINPTTVSQPVLNYIIAYEGYSG